MLYLSKKYIKGNLMASVEHLENKLSDKLKKNESFAIALTGEWGIGKTHFWKSFYEKNRENFTHKKYAYVSLFGIESLESLGYEIGIKSQATSTTEKKNKKISKVKSLFTGLVNNVKIPDLEVSGFALSIGQSLVSSIISNMVSETIICIDDLERKSDKLDMKDLMGFISKLKTEKNCQVIVILHQDKINEQNTEFQEYKEKVFDDVFYLTDNFSIIKEMIENTEMIDVYQEFYDKLQVKNLRFYQKVDKDFQNMMSLGHDFSYTSKEYILKNLMIIRLADLQQPTISYMKENNKKQFTFNLYFLLNFPKDKDDYDLAKYFHEYSDNFFSILDMDNWTRIVMSNLINHEIDSDTLKNLVENDITSEKNQELLTNHKKLLENFENFNVNGNFIAEFYQSMNDIIPFTNAMLLNKSYNILLSIDKKQANEYMKKVKENIKYRIYSTEQPRVCIERYIEDISLYKDDNCYNFLLDLLREYEYSQSYSDILQMGMTTRSLYQNQKLVDIAKDVYKEKVNNIDKNNLCDILWINEHVFFNRKLWITHIVTHPLFSDEKREQVRQWIVELLQEKMQENPDSKIPIQYWLEQTENLTKFD